MALGRRSTALEACEGVDLSGRNAMVTGANTGIGLETTRALALRGARVTMACRNQHKGEQARERILREAAGAIEPSQLGLLPLDLNSLAATREAAGQFLSLGQPLDLLINNAGVMLPMRRQTDDGFEAHLGVNHLGHFLFTLLLLEALLAAEAPRVVAVSSMAMEMASLRPGLEDINWEQRRFRGFPSYGDSKLMNHLFACELQRRYGERGLNANSLHPGIVITELGRDQSPLFKFAGVVVLPFSKNAAQGAATTLYVATSDDAGRKGGRYFNNCAEARPRIPWAGSADLAREVWQRSLELVGLDDPG